MRIVIFAHPNFVSSQSMPRYATWLKRGMESRGHLVQIWSPHAVFYKIPVPSSLKKWMGYIDQYLVFPLKVKRQIAKLPKDTLYVIADQALGPWVPLLKDLPHVIHCHDFLAQRSALGEISENITSQTGRWYQAFIRRGYQKGKNFISISKNTQTDLHRFLGRIPQLSEVVYNGLTQKFIPAGDLVALRKELSESFNLPLHDGFILHVGGNQWYKNKKGVIGLYTEWRKRSNSHLPLILVGNTNMYLEQLLKNTQYDNDIYVLKNVSDDMVKKLYAGASVFLFPSLAEGFGWPIAEAMASGCPVITTKEAPMTEVGGGAALYVERMAMGVEKEWAVKSSQILEEIIQLSIEDRKRMIELGLENVRRFDSDFSLDKIENIYKEIK
jgi:glycosyltransferase involved in cell wall biosynthesis